MDDYDDKESVDELYGEYDEDDDKGFHIQDRLPVPTALQYTTRDLHMLIHEGVIDLSPPYQREVVWPEAKQSRLIDSIFRNYYVPPVVFAQVIEDGSPVLRCVDGKQRLTSIQRFFDGHIAYKDPRTGKSYWYSASEQARNKIVVPNIWKNDFAEKRITCVKYDDLPTGLERDIFQRVQLGMPLSAAEKLQAITSPWADYIADLGRQMLTSDTGLHTKINVDVSRGKDFQIIGNMVLCCEGIPNSTIGTSTKLEAFLLRTDKPHETFKTAIRDVLKKFWHIADKPDLNRAFTEVQKRVAPAEFVFIGVLLYALRGCTDQQQARAVYDMRMAVRGEYQDVRLRDDIQRFLWGFISKRAEELDSGVHIDDAPAPVKKTKRKRASRADGDATNYTPAKAKGSPTKRPKLSQ